MFSKKVTPAAAAKPFCPVCQAAGKSEKEYTSHFVKSEPGPNGKVVCPTLLNQVCRYCDKSGHTAGYCPIIAENKAREEKEQKMKARQEAIEKREAENAAPKVVEKKKPTNMFAALDDSSDSDKEVKRAAKKTNKSKVVPVAAVANVETNAELAIRMAKGLLTGPKIIYHQSTTKPITQEEEFPSLPTKKDNDKQIITTRFEGYATVTAKVPEYSEAEMKHAMAKKAIPPVVRLNRKQEESVYSVMEDDWEEEYYPEPTVTASLTDWVGKKSWAELSYEDDEDW